MDQWFKAARTGDISYIKAHYRQMKGSRTVNGSYTALMIAAHYGCREIVSLLKTYEARIYCDTHWTALMFACDSGHQPIVQELAPLEAGLSDYRGITGLMRASLHGYTTIIKTLLSYEGELNAILKESVSDFPRGSNALIMAMMSGHRESVKMLLPLEFSSITVSTVQECIHNHELTDIQIDCVNLVTSFLEQRTLLNDPSFKSTHPWFYAAAINDTQYIKDHLSECANTTNPDDGNKCALFYAIIHGAKDVADILFELEKDCVDSLQNGFTSYIKNTVFKDITIGTSVNLAKQLASTMSDTLVTAEPVTTSPIRDDVSPQTAGLCTQNNEITSLPDQIENNKKPVSTASLLRATPRLTVPNTKPIPLRAANTRTTPQEARRPKSKDSKGIPQVAISPGPNRSRSAEKLALHTYDGLVNTPMKQTPSKNTTKAMRSNSRSSSASRSVPGRASSSNMNRNTPRKSINKTGPYSNETTTSRPKSANKVEAPAISKLVKESLLKANAQDMGQELVSICTSDNCRTILERTEENNSPRDLSLPCVSIGIANDEADTTDEAAHLFSHTKASSAEPSVHNSGTSSAHEETNSPCHDDCFKLLAKCAASSFGSTTITPGATNRPSKYSPRGDGSFEGAEKSLSVLLAGISERIERIDSMTRQNTEQCATLSAGFEKITTLITGHNEQIENIVKTQQALVAFMLQEKSNRDRSETGTYSAATPSSVTEECRIQPVVTSSNTNEPIVACIGEPNVKLNSMSGSVCGDAPHQLPILSPNESSLYDQTRFITKSIAPSTLSAIYTGPLQQSSVQTVSGSNVSILPKTILTPSNLALENVGASVMAENGADQKSIYSQLNINTDSKMTSLLNLYNRLRGYVGLLCLIFGLIMISSVTCSIILHLTTIE